MKIQVTEDINGMKYVRMSDEDNGCKRMTNEEAETKKHREDAIDALKEMRDMMMNDDNWEHMMRLVDAVTLGAFAIMRLNEIDFGKEHE